MEDEMNFQSDFQDEFESLSSGNIISADMPEQYPVQDAIGQQQVMMVAGMDQQMTLQPQLHQIQQPVQPQIQMTQPLQAAVMESSGQYIISQAVTPVTVVQTTVGSTMIQTQQLLPQQVQLQPQQRVIVSNSSETPTSTTQGRRTIIVQAQPVPPAPEVVAKPVTPTKTSGRRGAGRAGGAAQRKKKDPNAPAPVLTAYRSFFKETSQSVKTHNPAAKFGDVSRIVASMWESMPDEEKAVYRKKSEEDKIRFQRETEEYKARQGMQDSEPKSPEPSEPVTETSTSSFNETTESQGNTNGSCSSETPAPPPSFESENICIRKDCGNQAVRNPEWEDEYCSNECVVKHCTNVFNEWVLSNGNTDVAVS